MHDQQQQQQVGWRVVANVGPGGQVPVPANQQGQRGVEPGLDGVQPPYPYQEYKSFVYISQD